MKYRLQNVMKLCSLILMTTPTNIALIAKKGGVGKSTGTILLYEALRQAGRNVAIKDWDAQGTSTKTLRLITAEKPEVNGKPDIVIWDTPPSLEHTATGTAVRNADIALVVTTPGMADSWEAEEAVLFVRNRNPKAVVRVVFNKFRKATVLAPLRVTLMNIFPPFQQQSKSTYIN